MRGFLLRGLMPALALVLVAASYASAQDDFYKGRTITIVVGYSAGGGYDQYARLLARHYGRHIPGNPNVIVQNMPGAASMTSVRYLDATAPKDGTVITTLRSGLITQVLTSDKPVVNFAELPVDRHAPARHPHLLRLARDRHQDDRRRAQAQGVPDRRHRQGLQRLCQRRDPAQRAQGAGATDRRLSRQRRAAHGARARRARRQLRLLDRHAAGLARAEEDQSAGALLAEAPGRHVPPTSPMSLDLAKTQEDKDVIDILNSPGELGRPFIVAKQVPAERVKALRAALAGDAEGRGLPRRGEEAEPPARSGRRRGGGKDHGEIYAAPPDLIGKAKAVLD